MLLRLRGGFRGGEGLSGRISAAALRRGGGGEAQTRTKKQAAKGWRFNAVGGWVRRQPEKARGAKRAALGWEREGFDGRRESAVERGRGGGGGGETKPQNRTSSYSAGLRAYHS
jgi:hypothetical protein